MKFVQYFSARLEAKPFIANMDATGVTIQAEHHWHSYMRVDYENVNDLIVFLQEIKRRQPA